MKRFFAFFTYFFIVGFALADSLTCHNNMEKVVAVFQPIPYTCISGYFLPARATGCRVCPNGYTCSGGTFAFNENIAQGLVRNSSYITQNMNNACDINTKKSMAAIFVASDKVVNINWENGGEVSTTMCVYGDEFALPPAPTRIGYTFTGWKVKTNNNE